jgi:hypothetical protein
MSTEKPVTENTFYPQYFIIPKSEPQYDQIKKHLLDSTHRPAGSSHYFIRAAHEKGCVCRINDGNGTVLFYEILDHLKEGISDEDIRAALRESSNTSPLPGYFHISPKIEQKLHAFQTTDSSCYHKKCEHRSLA